MAGVDWLEVAKKRLTEVGLRQSQADYARLVVEPVLRWAGYSVTGAHSVRRDVRLAPCLRPATFVCRHPGEQAVGIAVWLQEDLSDVAVMPAVEALSAWRRYVEGESVPAMIAFTNGGEWRIVRLGSAERWSEVDPGSIDRAGSLDSIRRQEQYSKPTTAKPFSADGGTGAAAPRAGQQVKGKPVPERGSPSRVEGAGKPAQALRSYRERPYIPAKETHTKPSYVLIDGRRIACGTWAEAVEIAARHHLERMGALPTGKILKKQRRVYFSRKAGDITTRPRTLPSGWYMEDCLSAHLAAEIAIALIRRTGVSNYDILFE